MGNRYISANHGKFSHVVKVEQSFYLWLFFNAHWPGGRRVGRSLTRWAIFRLVGKVKLTGITGMDGPEKLHIKANKSCRTKTTNLNKTKSSH